MLVVVAAVVDPATIVPDDVLLLPPAPTGRLASLCKTASTIASAVASEIGIVPPPRLVGGSSLGGPPESRGVSPLLLLSPLLMFRLSNLKMKVSKTTPLQYFAKGHPT